jgi:hypothetical protein
MSCPSLVRKDPLASTGQRMSPGPNPSARALALRRIGPHPNRVLKKAGDFLFPVEPLTPWGPLRTLRHRSGTADLITHDITSGATQ